MEFDLLDRFGDENALTKQTKFILDLLKQIEEGGSQTAAVLKNIKFTTTGSSGLEGQIKAMKEFATVTDNYSKKVTALAGQEAKLLEIQKKQSDLITKQINEKKALTAAENEVIKQIALEEKATQAIIKTKTDQLKYEELLEKQKQRLGSQAAAEAKIAEQLTNEYYQLGQALKDAELRYKNLALTQGFESQAAKDALEQALSMRNVLDKLDGNLRNYQRNVGNYKSAFDGLGMSFTQIARELPSLGINLQTFLLAISNNIPAVFDEIGKAKDEIAALRAQGQETPGMFERIAKSAFSLQVGLSILVTLFTVFGSKIIEGIVGLFDYSAAQEKAAEAAYKLQKAQRELISTLKEVDELIQKGFTPINDIDRLQEELKLSQNLGKSRGDLLKIEKEILNAQSLRANLKFQETRGFAGLDDLKAKLIGLEDQYLTTIKEINDRSGKDIYGNDFTDEDRKPFEKKKERLKEEMDFVKGQLAEQVEVVRNNFKALNEEYQKDAEIAEYFRQEKLEKEIAYTVKSQNARITAAEKVLNDERNFEAARTAAIRKEADARKKIIAADLRREAEKPSNKNADGTETAALVKARTDAATSIMQIDAKMEQDIYNNHITFRNRRLKAENEYLQAEVTQNIEFNKEILSSDYYNTQQRSEALVTYLDGKQRLIMADYALELNTKVHTNEELKALEKKKDKELNDLLKEGIKERNNIIVTAGTEELKAYQAAEERRVSFQKFLNAKFIRNKEKRNEENRKLEYESKRAELLIEIQHQQDILNSTDTTAAAKVDAQNELNKKMAALYKLDTANFLSEEDKKLAGLNKFKDEVLAVIDLIGQAQNIDYVRTRNRIRDEQDAAEKKAARDIEIAALTSTTEEEKANKIAVINARLQAQKDEFARRERKAEEQKAKFEKARTLFQIGLELAIAISTLNWFKAAVSAAQFAIVAATPIPRYFKGKKKGQAVAGGGMALVDEGADGRGNSPEAIIRKDGSIEIGGNTPRLTYLDKDDEVISNDYLKSIYASAFGSRDAGGKAVEDKTARLLEAQNESNNLLRQIADKPVQIIQGSEKGVRALHAWASRQIEYKNDMTNF